MTFDTQALDVINEHESETYNCKTQEKAALQILIADALKRQYERSIVAISADASNEISANAVMEFVNTQVGAFESSFVDGNQISLYSMYRFAQHHVKDNYHAETKLMSEVWGEELVKADHYEELYEQHKDKCIKGEL